MKQRMPAGIREVRHPPGPSPYAPQGSMPVTAVLLAWVWITTAGSTVQAADIYRWVDEQGVPHFTSAPRPDAERVDLAPISVIDTPAPDASRAGDAGPAAGAANGSAGDVQRVRFNLRIAQPTDGETQWADDRRLQIVTAVAPQPVPGSGLQVAVFIDGERRAVAPSVAPSRVLVIDDVDRGTHEIHAELIDARGRVLARTPPSTVHIRQHHQ